MSGPYLEAVWLGIIGPSAAWTLRRLVVQLSAQSSGYDLVVTDLAADLGLGKGSGHNSRVMASVTRLVLFDLARWSGPEELQVRQFLPPGQLRGVQSALPNGQASAPGRVAANTWHRAHPEPRPADQGGRALTLGR